MQQPRALTQPSEQPVDRISILAGRWPALGVLFLGVTVLYFVGFANFRQAHNAAHDTRHASGFPCH